MSGLLNRGCSVLLVCLYLCLCVCICVCVCVSVSVSFCFVVCILLVYICCLIMFVCFAHYHLSLTAKHGNGPCRSSIHVERHCPHGKESCGGASVS